MISVVSSVTETRFRQAKKVVWVGRGLREFQMILSGLSLTKPLIHHIICGTVNPTVVLLSDSCVRKITLSVVGAGSNRPTANNNRKKKTYTVPNDSKNVQRSQPAISNTIQPPRPAMPIDNPSALIISMISPAVVDSPIPIVACRW